MLHVAQILSYGILNGTLYGLVALGLSLVFGVMNYLMIAHGGLIVLPPRGGLMPQRIIQMMATA